MTKLQEIYRCDVCENIVEVLHTGKGELVCCNQPMELMTENTVDASKEKHVPVVEEKNGRVEVRVGSSAHPMEAKHYIEWIQIINGGKSERTFLKPTDKPEAKFECTEGKVRARAYCNLHRLWSG